MKKRNLLLVFGFVILLCGCQELIGSFSSNVNGTAWEATVSGAVKSNGHYIITADKGNATLVITVSGTSVGTYNVNPLDSTFEAVAYTPDYNNAVNSYVSTQGVVDLTKVNNNRLTGTFNVWAKNTQTSTDSMQITGQFSNILSN